MKTNRVFRNQVAPQQRWGRSPLWMRLGFPVDPGRVGWLGATPDEIFEYLKQRVDDAVRSGSYVCEAHIPIYEGDLPEAAVEQSPERELPRNEDYQTFSCRVDCLEEIDWHLKNLIEWLGDDFEAVEVWSTSEPSHHVELTVAAA